MGVEGGINVIIAFCYFFHFSWSSKQENLKFWQHVIAVFYFFHSLESKIDHFGTQKNEKSSKTTTTCCQNLKKREKKNFLKFSKLN